LTGVGSGDVGVFEDGLEFGQAPGLRYCVLAEEGDERSPRLSCQLVADQPVIEAPWGDGKAVDGAHEPSDLGESLIRAA
jgi:hypothetical protein